MADPVLIEICVDSVASAVAAERGGAARVELCSGLEDGGVTPSAGMIEAVRGKISIGLHVIIRPRAGDFCYTPEEFDIMRKDILAAKSRGTDGVVLGILNENGNVDLPRTRELVMLARPMNVTFHRAFDVSTDLFRALEDVCSTGANRLLTSGGEQNCIHGVETISKLVQLARGRIAIMAGRGINESNATSIIERTGVKEIHVGTSTYAAAPTLYRTPRISMGRSRGSEYQRIEVLEENVRKLKRAISPINSYQ
jgi:copper homeostasis protein